MAENTWLEVVAMCEAPALIVLLCVGVVSIYQDAKLRLLDKREEVDHEI